MLKCFCNSCKREMTGAQIEASGVVQREWASKYPNWALATQTEGQDDTFCPDHLPLAPEYWLDKVGVLEKLNDQASSTLKNHCKDFFKGNREAKDTKLKYAGKAIHRNLKQVSEGPPN